MVNGEMTSVSNTYARPPPPLPPSLLVPCCLALLGNWYLVGNLLAEVLLLTVFGDIYLCAIN